MESLAYRLKSSVSSASCGSSQSDAATSFFLFEEEVAQFPESVIRRCWWDAQECYLLPLEEGRAPVEFERKAVNSA
jgi:hypothetical protein